MKILYIDMDDVLCDFISAYKITKENRPDIDFPQSIPGFFLNLAPLDGAIDAYHCLVSQPELDVHILSAPSVLNPHSYTEKRLWIENHLGIDAAHKLILSSNKGLSIGDFLIDDFAHGKGQENFIGELIHFGSPQYPDWSTVTNYLLRASRDD